MSRWYIVTLDEAPGSAASWAIVEEDGTTVCNPSPMGESNARLIANAPALLEALQEMTDQYERLLVESRITQRDAKAMRKMMPHYTGAARAVIAQATGEKA